MNKTNAIMRQLLRGVRLTYTAAKQSARHSWFFAKPVILQIQTGGEIHQSLTSGEFRRILGDPLFSAIQIVQLASPQWEEFVFLAELNRNLPQLRRLDVLVRGLDVTANTTLPNFIQTAVSSGIPVTVRLIAEKFALGETELGVLPALLKDISAIGESGISIAASYALTAENCYMADDALNWCERNGIREWFFHLSPEIDNALERKFDGLTELTADQRFHLLMFFEQLSYRRDLGLKQRLFYKNVVARLAGHDAAAAPSLSAAPAPCRPRPPLFWICAATCATVWGKKRRWGRF
jgi:hypothetical protein